MYFRQFYLGCLAHASYLIGSNGEAAVVDPQRDVEQYLREAEEAGLAIRYVIETHLHADFVSGHRELAERTGAEIVIGHAAAVSFPHRAAHDGDQLRVGTVTMSILETPGHTPEGISILVADTADPSVVPKVLTGDTLFIGDVGRPDLVGSKGFTSEQMASMLYDSLHTKLLTLDDAVEVYPAHGAGSLCGRNISKETSSTIGAQRQFNYALKPMDRASFVSLMTENLPEVPAYFRKAIEMNRTGASSLEHVARPAAMSPGDLAEAVEGGAVVLDVRMGAEFGAGHIPGALNIGLGGQFASWAGSLIPLQTPIIVVANDVDGVDEARVRLARVGFESVIGYLAGGMPSWDDAGLPESVTPQLPVDAVKSRLGADDQVQLVDVRRPAEYLAGHAPGALNIQLADLESRLDVLDATRPTLIICQSGYRSSAATSILSRHGFSDVSNVIGGTAAWLAAEYPAETEATAACQLQGANSSQRAQ
ncbi:MAG: MBL fold metallo-hydrolase [Blastocatellia bacterium]|nr:MBL fold metallo-hydrolase [Blastocatellia bacterium]